MPGLGLEDNFSTEEDKETGLALRGDKDLGRERPFSRGSISLVLISSSSEEMIDGRGLDRGLEAKLSCAPDDGEDDLPAIGTTAGMSKE